MAEDFLKKYQTRGMSVDQIKELLGEPDFGSESWRYNLNLDGSATSQQQVDRTNIPNQYFWIVFQGLHVEQLGITNRQDMKDGLEFDSILWKAGQARERVKMVASLVESGIMKGRSKGEVREILGKPDAESEKREIEYNLGVRMIDYETLTFTLDDEGKVSEARIIEH